MHVPHFVGVSSAKPSSQAHTNIQCVSHMPSIKVSTLYTIIQNRHLYVHAYIRLHKYSFTAQWQNGHIISMVLYCKVVRKVEKYRQMLCPTCTCNMSLFAPCSAVPPPIDGFTASSPTSTSIALLWKEPTATIDYYKVSGQLENYS